MLGTPTNARKKFPMVINNNRGTPGPQAATLQPSVAKAQFTTQ